jgi:tRNA threonylcarbamoyladenosine biosynthesis protein TsaB
LALLSLDTATDVATACVSVHDGDRVVAVAESAVAARVGGRAVGAQRVLADVRHLLAAAGLELAQVELIVAGTGPGSFTGLRIGLAAARALGDALSVPVRGVSTLDAILHGGVDVACIDARRGEVFAAGGGIAPCVLAPADLARRLPAGAVVAGDGAVRHRDELPGADIPPDGSPLHVPWARHHAALHRAAGPPDPVYGRAPDADRSLAAGPAR